MSEQMGYIHRPRADGEQRDLAQGEAKDANQLTIFYAGSISVFEGVSPEKAQAIMLIAAAAAAGGMAPIRSPPSVQSSNSAGPEFPHTPNLAPGGGDPITSIQNEIPLARRNSLQRFLEKRRERLANMAPYVAAVTKPVDMSPESHTGSKASSPADSFNNEATGPY